MLKFIFPIECDVLNANAGLVKGCSLSFTARLYSDSGTPVVNGQTALFDEESGEYKVELSVNERRNMLIADTGSEKCEICVHFFKSAVGHYQFFIDDNIRFFRDIAEHDYTSIYENPYLAFFKSMYDKYGTLVHMHVYYETDGFNLSMMPDKYKSEWREAASWLRLTFHARADKPDYPHRNASYEDTLRELDRVTNEIIRFAGEEILSPATVPHWNEMSVGAGRAFRERGFRIIPGIELSAQYKERGLDIGDRKRDFWYDREEDIYTCYGDICLNKGELSEIVPKLNAAKANPETAGFIYMMIHEQYFYEGFEDYVPNYVCYLPDFKERVETAIKWASENGYTSRWLEDIVLE